MTTSNNDLFYTRLPVNQLSLSDLLTEEHLFFKIPSSWHVLITDVKKSTVAVENGLHETVNLVATGSIVAVLNIAYKENLTIPFFFGGDGATFIVPPIILDAVMKALIKHQQNTEVNFGIMLRVGHVPVEKIYAEGHSLNISKLRTSDLFSIPVLLGNGLSYAERIIKGEAYLLTPPTLTDDELDMSGMQCRWDKIKPPENYDEVVSLLVVCREQVNQAEVFKKVIDHIDKIYGNHQKRQPITVSKLKLKGTLKKIGREMQVRMGSYKPMYLLRTWFTTLLGSLYFRTKPGKRYLAQLVDMSDTLVIDGKINTVISGTQQQRKELDAALNELEKDGYINYGLHVSKESVMSCYVRGMDEHHIHFIDGSDGGYTKAASVLKKKIYQH
ncbi:MAG: DUF3095 domain-containing protein [Chitinophagaceae bacterium]|nr:DUF3095 domain-containing protein [Chitinophagaceae bacterium]